MLELITSVDGAEWNRTRAPADLAPRAWVLGVVAVQLTVEDGKVLALVRASLTGTEPCVRALPSRCRVDVALAEAGLQARVPSLPPTPPASLSIFLDGAAIDRATLAPALHDASPPARAFGHVYCRWLRDGTTEPGFDLTDFVSQPPGRKYERRVSRPLAPGHLVSYLLHF